MQDVRPSVAIVTALLVALAGASWWALLRPSDEIPEPERAAPDSRPATDDARRGADAGPPETGGAPAEAPPPTPAPGVRAQTAAPESDVPHQVVTRTSPDPEATPAEGRHQLLVIAVDPHLPTADLERLLRDLRDRHRDAAVLDIRIYDSADAARAERYDTGASRDRHQVARVLRNDRIGVDTIRIRGVTLDP